MNIVGGGVTAIGRGANGMTAPFCVLVIIDFRPEFDGEKFQFALELVHRDGQPVDLEGPDGKSRVQIFQEMTAGMGPDSPDIQRRQGTPPGVIPVGVRTVVNLATGLPLIPNEFYGWRLSVDGEEGPGWNTLFFVADQERA